MTAKKTQAKVTKTTEGKAYKELNKRVTVLEKLVQELVSQKPKARKQREYTDEQRASIRARLLAGQETAKKKREAEAKASKKVRPVTSEKDKAVATEKPIEA